MSEWHHPEYTNPGVERLRVLEDDGQFLIGIWVSPRDKGDWLACVDGCGEIQLDGTYPTAAAAKAAAVGWLRDRLRVALEELGEHEGREG